MCAMCAVVVVAGMLYDTTFRNRTGVNHVNDVIRGNHTTHNHQNPPFVWHVLEVLARLILFIITLGSRKKQAPGEDRVTTSNGDY
jgi:hypothetical protein